MKSCEKGSGGGRVPKGGGRGEDGAGGLERRVGLLVTSCKEGRGSEGKQWLLGLKSSILFDIEPGPHTRCQNQLF